MEMKIKEETPKGNTPTKESFEVAYKYWRDNDFRDILKVDPEKIKEFNDEPVAWCTVCGSLSILDYSMPNKSEEHCYCMKCNSTSVKEGHIEEWLNIKDKQNN